MSGNHRADQTARARNAVARRLFIGTFLAGAAVGLATPAVAGADWGAIAFDPATHNFGQDRGASPEVAKANAVAGCVNGGAAPEGCQIVALTEGGCTALVKVADGNWVGGAGPSREEAINAAAAGQPVVKVGASGCL